ncbi:MAG: ABC transporter ATP-binding protein [Bacteroidales bacterium]|nr:ABC transporter ATP-binding protein [Bacteroidales bacterium]
MILAENITKSYGKIDVLKGINIEVKKGEIVSIVGSSGAGKTTLLQILGTLTRKDKGNIIINNTNLDALSEKQLARFRNLNLGFVFQFHHLLPEFTALENVCIPGFIAGKSKTQVIERAKELINHLNMSERLNHKPAELSGGEKQRIAIARALINEPEVILADEPSGNLDSQNTKELYELITKLRAEFNQTFVVVTHNIKLAEVSDKTYIINDGLIING